MAWVHPMATRPEGVPETIRHLTAELYAWLARAEFARIEVMFARHRQSSGTTIERKLLFPVDLQSLALAQPQLSPLHNLPPATLLEKLIADYVFGTPLMKMSRRSWKNCARMRVESAKTR